MTHFTAFKTASSFSFSASRLGAAANLSSKFLIMSSFPRLCASRTRKESKSGRYQHQDRFEIEKMGSHSDRTFILDWPVSIVDNDQQKYHSLIKTYWNYRLLFINIQFLHLRYFWPWKSKDSIWFTEYSTPILIWDELNHSCNDTNLQKRFVILFHVQLSTFSS